MGVPPSERMDNFFDVVSEEKLLKWEVCLERLRVDDSKVRMDAASKLRHCVERAVRELSTESFEKFEAELHQRVFRLLNEQVSCGSVVSSALFHRVGALYTYIVVPGALFFTDFLQGPSCVGMSCAGNGSKGMRNE